jgi:serine protease Do
VSYAVLGRCEMQKAHRCLRSKAACVAFLAVAGCAGFPSTPGTQPTAPAPTKDVCSTLWIGSTSFEKYGRPTFDGNECFRRAREGDPEAMEAVLSDRLRGRSIIDDNTQRSLTGHEVRSLLAKYKAGDVSVRDELNVKFWSLWACREGVSQILPNPVDGECKRRALSGEPTAALIQLGEDKYSRPGNFYVRKIAESASKGDSASRAWLPKALATYFECNARAQAGGDCEDLARAGDRVAISWMERRASEERRDIERFRWGAALVLAGDIEYIDGIIDEYSKGGVVPRNAARLNEIVEVGAERGHLRSMLAKAAYVQDIDPATAFDLYARAAAADNCYGQAMLAASFRVGVFSEVNEAKAYFWWLLASRERHSGSGYMAMPPYLGARLVDAYGGFPSLYEYQFNRGCPAFRGSEFGAMEAKTFSQEVKDLITEWRPGNPPPRQLERFKDVRVDDAPALVQASVAAPRAKMKKWNAVVLERPVTLDAELRADVLYERLSKAVYVVVAAPSKRALAQRDGIAQGSAVAVDSGTLLTNCHIIEGRPDVRVLVSGKLLAAEVRAANIPADTCILSVPGADLSPVIGTRRSGALRVGEDVYAIGSPRGFTNSLSKGLISQVRSDSERVLVQTTAQISGGSSGGGLFDRFGNLIGITTFKIANAEGLNFAIALDEFVARK